MKFNKNIFLSLFALGTVASTSTYAGNEDRAGSAGATEVNINPWARSLGWGDAGVASVTGLEAMFVNVAGLAFADGTEISFARTNWLGSAAGIGLNTFGLAQKLGESGVFGLAITSFDYGDIQVTTTELPEGGIGNFSPSSLNFTLSYAKQFSTSISGGLNLKIVSSSISNVKAQGMAIDAGIRYVTGENDQMKFAISLRNVGAPIKYSGDGLAIEMQNITTELEITSEQRAASFELPSQLHIGTSYDFIFNEKSLLTMALAYTSNSFTRDQWRLGGEYTIKSDKAHFILRAGYVYESEIFSKENRATAITGPTGGFTIDFPIGENETTLGLDYGVRTGALGVIHTVGARINLGGK